MRVVVSFSILEDLAHEVGDAAKRRVITTHDAFAYYRKAYRVAFMAPEGLNTESEPSAKTVAELIRQIRREGIRALLFENISDPRLMEEIARESGATLGPPLYSDALSGPDGPAPTYIRMIEYNTAATEGGNAQELTPSLRSPASGGRPGWGRPERAPTEMRSKSATICTFGKRRAASAKISSVW